MVETAAPRAMQRRRRRRRYPSLQAASRDLCENPELLPDTNQKVRAAALRLHLNHGVGQPTRRLYPRTNLADRSQIGFLDTELHPEQPSFGKYRAPISPGGPSPPPREAASSPAAWIILDPGDVHPYLLEDYRKQITSIQVIFDENLSELTLEPQVRPRT